MHKLNRKPIKLVHGLHMARAWLVQAGSGWKSLRFNGLGGVERLVRRPTRAIGMAVEGLVGFVGTGIRVRFLARARKLRLPNTVADGLLAAR